MSSQINQINNSFSGLGLNDPAGMKSSAPQNYPPQVQPPSNQQQQQFQPVPGPGFRPISSSSPSVSSQLTGPGPGQPNNQMNNFPPQQQQHQQVQYAPPSAGGQPTGTGGNPTSNSNYNYMSGPPLPGQQQQSQLPPSNYVNGNGSGSTNTGTNGVGSGDQINQQQQQQPFTTQPNGPLKSMAPQFPPQPQQQTPVPPAGANNLPPMPTQPSGPPPTVQQHQFTQQQQQQPPQPGTGMLPPPVSAAVPPFQQPPVPQQQQQQQMNNMSMSRPPGPGGFVPQQQQQQQQQPSMPHMPGGNQQFNNNSMNMSNMASQLPPIQQQYPQGPPLPQQQQQNSFYPNNMSNGPMPPQPNQQQQQQYSRPPLPGQTPPMPPMMGQQYQQQQPNNMMPPQNSMMPPQPQQQQFQHGGILPGGQPAAPFQGVHPSAPAQQKKLDPEQMPSAIGVMQEDQNTRGGIFQTNQKGALPPLVTTKFQCDDQGNVGPRYVRSTMYSVPTQPDMLKQTAIPFAIVVNPFESPQEGEMQLACVDLGPMGPVRCLRCKAYMSPLMNFIDGGRRFQCMLCKATTEVPPEYFQHLDHTGQRVDKWERPELWKGSYEFIATAEYCRNNILPKEPAYIFVIDVSYNNVKSGLVNLLCSHMKTLLESLPPHTPIGFITYNSKVHFYNIDKSLAQPQMVIVPDVADMFMPILKGFLVPRAEASDAVDALMNQIPKLFADTKETESVVGSAIQAGMEALKASERVGKLLILHSSLPTSEVAPGKLKNREADRKLLGTDKEKTVLTPQSTFYTTLGQECVTNGCSVDLYLFNNSYIDVATLGQVARLSGGSVNKYTYFQGDIDGPRVVGELKYHLSRPAAFDAVMRVRTSTGVRATDFYGHFYMANTTDVELAAIDSSKAISVEIKHDDKLDNEDGVYIQIALLYTSIFGQRRLRVHNLALNTCSQMADLYRNCELDCIINFLAKQGISKSIDTTPAALKEGVINRCAQMLATYRKHCANPSMPGQLILPECLKLLPLYINCVLRSDAFAGNQEITPDDRSWLMYSVMTMGVGHSVHYFYPKLIPVAGPTANHENPQPVRCSFDKLREDSAFILVNGIYIFLWIGSAISPDWLQDIFGVSNLAQLNVETITEIPDHVTSDNSLKLRALIRSLRNEMQRHMRLTVVRQRDKMELVMNKFLVEDRGGDGSPSYVDFLCHMHKEIRALLNQ